MVSLGASRDLRVLVRVIDRFRLRRAELLPGLLFAPAHAVNVTDDRRVRLAVVPVRRTFGHDFRDGHPLCVLDAQRVSSRSPFFLGTFQNLLQDLFLEVLAVHVMFFRPDNTLIDFRKGSFCRRHETPPYRSERFCDENTGNKYSTLWEKCKSLRMGVAV